MRVLFDLIGLVFVSDNFAAVFGERDWYEKL